MPSSSTSSWFSTRAAAASPAAAPPPPPPRRAATESISSKKTRQGAACLRVAVRRARGRGARAVAARFRLCAAANSWQAGRHPPCSCAHPQLAPAPRTWRSQTGAAPPPRSRPATFAAAPGRARTKSWRRSGAPPPWPAASCRSRGGRRAGHRAGRAGRRQRAAERGPGAARQGRPVLPWPPAGAQARAGLARCEWVGQQEAWLSS